MRKSAVVAVLIALLTAIVRPAAAEVAPAVVNVPADQTTIQAGIDAVADHGTVVVAPGVYQEDYISFRGKAIEVRSAAGPDATVIRGVVAFGHQEGRASVLRGFTVRGGANGVSVYEAGPSTSGAPALYNNLIYSGNGPSLVCGSSGVAGPGPAMVANLVYSASAGPAVAGCDGTVVGAGGNLSADPLLIGPGATCLWPGSRPRLTRARAPPRRCAPSTPAGGRGSSTGTETVRRSSTSAPTRRPPARRCRRVPRRCTSAPFPIFASPTSSRSTSNSWGARAAVRARPHAGGPARRVRAGLLPGQHGVLQPGGCELRAARMRPPAADWSSALA